MSESFPQLDETNPAGFYVWRVCYDCRFESASGMERYHIDHKYQRGIVLTRTADLNAVCEEIGRAIGNQSFVTELRECTYLGTSINNPNDHE